MLNIVDYGGFFKNRKNNKNENQYTITNFEDLTKIKDIHELNIIHLDHSYTYTDYCIIGTGYEIDDKYKKILDSVNIDHINIYEIFVPCVKRGDPKVAHLSLSRCIKMNKSQSNSSRLDYYMKNPPLFFNGENNRYVGF
jgi:hypothetical protein